MSKIISSTLRVGLLFLLGLLLSLNITPVFAADTPPKLNWISGPQTVTMGDNLSKLNIPKDYSFINAEDTSKFLQYIGSSPSENDIGLVVPNDDKKDWMVAFSYAPIGYVKDDEAASIDKDRILQRIKEATEEATKQRQNQSLPPIHVTGWQEAPHYNPQEHSLVWAVVGTEGSETIVNYNTRKLGRNGFTSINLVTYPENLARAKPEIDQLIANYTYLPGKQYTDFVPGQDAVAEFGLAALIAGGIGASAVKSGLLAKILLILVFGLKKLWIFMIIGIIATLKSLSKKKAAVQVNLPNKTKS